MGSGALNRFATILQLQGIPPMPVSLGSIWVGITRRPAGAGLSNAEQPPVRQAGILTMMARRDNRLVPGRYLRIDAEFYHIDGAVDRDNRGAMLELTCTALAGEMGLYQPVTPGETAYLVPVAVQQDNPTVGGTGRVSEIRYRVQIPRVALRESFIRGDRVTVAGVDYGLSGVTEQGDDGVVLQLWAMPIIAT